MKAPSRLLAMDWAALGYLGAVAILIVAAGARVPAAPFWAALHLALAGGVVALVRAASRLPAWLRWWYPVGLVPLVFRLNLHLVPLVHPRDYDAELLAWDRRLFGAHPGTLLDPIASPALTVLLRLCWLSYFVLPFLVAVPLYRRGEAGRAAFAETALALTLGWYLSYLGYFLVPAVGPGYTPAEVGTPPAPAEPVTAAVLALLWRLEGVRARDVFPSGHVLIACLCLWAAFRHRLAYRWWLVPPVLGLLLGTVYLRFHYGVDVLAGLALAAWIAAALTLLRPEGGKRT